MFPTNPRNTLKCPQTIHICFAFFFSPFFFFLNQLEILTAVYWTKTTQTVTPGTVYSVGWRRPTKEGKEGGQTEPGSERRLAAGDMNSTY